MSSCSTCKKKFNLFKLNRTKCMECGLGYCSQCIRKTIRAYCPVCAILNDRPANRDRVMDLRSKEVKLYLARRKVSTEHCIEKEDLVNRFIWYVETEPRGSRNENKRTNLLNGFMSTLTSSMPNLFDQNITRRNDAQNSGTAVHNQPSSSQQNRPTTFAETHYNHTPAEYTNSTPSSSTTTEPTHRPTESLSANQTPKNLIRLSDIHSADEIPNLSVKQLKELLFINRVDFKGCVEKEELSNKAIGLWKESKSEDTDNMPTEQLCKICMDAPLNSVLLECGHIATCIDCGKKLAECPICRQYIVRIVHTFKA